MGLIAQKKTLFYWIYNHLKPLEENGSWCFRNNSAFTIFHEGNRIVVQQDLTSEPRNMFVSII